MRNEDIEWLNYLESLEEWSEEYACPYFWATKRCLRCRGLIKKLFEPQNPFWCPNCELVGIDFCGYCTVFECPLYETFQKLKGEIGPRTAFKQKGKNKYSHIIMPADLNLPDTIDITNPHWRKNLFPKEI